MATACTSVAAYSNSHTRSGPSQSIQARFSHGGHGAAMCITTSQRRDVVAQPLPSASRQIRPIIVGTAYR